MRVVAAVMIVLALAAPAAAQNLPQQPQVFLDTTYAPPTGGQTITVNAGGNLQNAFNSANPGDVIVLQAGATFTGNFVLPFKSGTGWIYVRTSAYASLPAPGTRVNPSHANLMPKMVSPNTTPALTTAFGAHHWRFVGIEIATTHAVRTSTHGNIILFGFDPNGNPATTLAQFPNFITFDRCYVHGTPTGNIVRGVTANSANTAVIDSYISDIHSSGQDSQAIGLWTGPGPFKFVNNYLEASGENIMFGGASPTITNLVPSDAEIRHNHFFKPLKWRQGDPSYAGIAWVVKNLFELKNAQRILIDGNIFENSWPAAQAGIAIQLTVRNDDNIAPWSTVQDITFTRNIVRHAAGGVNFLGIDNNATAQQEKRILIRDNIFEDLTTTTDPRLFQILNNPADVTIEHNTAIFQGPTIMADEDPSTRFVFRNNLVQEKQGVIGTGTGRGLQTLNTYFPGWVYAGNVQPGGPAASYPTGNFFPASMAAVGFVNLAGGNYRLSPTSPFKNAGTDGTDPGADIDDVEDVTAGVLTGVSGPPPGPGDTTPPTVSIQSPTGGTVSGTVTITASASDDTAVTRIDYLRDGQMLAALSPPVLTFAWDTTAESNGSHSLTARAWDAAGNSTTSAARTVTVSNANPLPTLTALAPATGTTGGAAFTLTLTGTGFGPSSSVRWNGAARTTTLVSATQLTAAITAADIAAPGTASVTVFNPTPGGGTSGAQTLTINAAAPTLASISPNNTTAGTAGLTVTANGTNFVSTSQVRWAGATRPTTFVSATQLTATLTAADLTTAGTFQVSVITPLPGGGTSANRNFTVNNPAPGLTTLSPSNATAGSGGLTLTLTGTGFVAASSVRWNGAARTTTFVSATELTATITAADVATAGTASVTVVNGTPGGGTSPARTFTIDATNPVPGLSALSPSSATEGGAGFTLTVTGTNFVAASTVNWNGAARPTTFVSATQLTATINAGRIAAQGTASVTVVNPAPGGGTSGAQTFTIDPPGPAPAPTLASLSPNAGVAGGGGLTLTVTGTNFVAASVVRWNGADRPTTVVSATQMTAAIAAADVAAAGTASVTVFTPAPGGGTSGAQTFTISVVPNPAPTLSSISPNNALVGAAGLTVTANGSNFVSGSQVRWNGAVRTTTFVSATQLTATLTAADLAATGTSQVSVITPAPGGGTSVNRNFTVNNPAPAVTTLSPNNAVAGTGGFTLTLTGSGFVATSSVRWNGAARTTTVVSATQLTATITAADVAAAGTASVTVVTPTPGGGTSPARSFTIIPTNFVPGLSGLLPASVMEGSPGFTLTVTGANFVAASTVNWNGAARPTTFVSATQLAAAIAAGDITAPGTASVTVFTPAPGGGTSPAQSFTINAGNPAPELNTLAPASTTEGAAAFTMTVTGTNFISGSRVHWNGSPRTTTFMNSTRLAAAIAAADVATPGDVDVTVVSPAPGGGASTPKRFTRMLSKRLLTLSRQGSGSGQVTSAAPAITCSPVCTTLVDRGASVTLAAAAASGSVFTGWSGACAGTASTCTVVLDTAKTVTANFTLLSVVSFSAATYGVSEAGPAATITVTRTGGTHAGVSVDVATSDGTAHAGSDYGAVAQTLTFAAGQTSRTFTVAVSNGTLADGSKMLNLALGNLQGLAVLGTRTAATLTIGDNDLAGRVQFGVAASTVVERADVPTTALIRVTRTGGAASGVTVDVATSDGTARAGTDYTAVARTLTFGAGETFKDVPVTILPDTRVEGDETLTLALSAPGGGGQLGTVAATTLTILDAQTGVHFKDAVYRAIERTGTATVTVIRTGPTTGTTTVAYSTADGTALAGVDYTTTAGVLTFAPRVTSRTFSVPLRDDTVVDGVKTVLLMLGAVTNGGVGPQSTAVLTINDNDAGGAMRFSTAAYSVSEKTATMTITVIRTSGLASAVTVDYATSDGTATAGQDYTATSGRLTFLAGQASRTFTVAILPDALVEPAETITLTLSNPTGGATLGTPATAALTILNDDVAGTVRFSATAYRVSEGGSATITVLRSSGAAGAVTVNFTTVDGTAVAGTDYTATSGTLTFSAAETSKTFTVPTTLNPGAGRDRVLTLALSAPGGGGTLAAPSSAQLTIQDTTTSLELGAAVYPMGEAKTSVTVTVLRSGPTTGVASVRYATADGTAVAGQDYTAASGVLTFTAGVTARTFTVVLKPDTLLDGDKTILLALSDPVGAVLGARSTAQIALADDDGPGTVQLSAPAYQVTEGGSATITVLRTVGWGSAVTVPYAVTAGTAAAGVDFVAASGVLTFAPGVTSRTFTVATLGDTLVEGARTVSITLGAPTGGATLGSPATAVLTVADNDLGGTVKFSASVGTVTEGGAITFWVYRGSGAAGAVTVQYAATGGTAVAGADYVALGGTLTFAASQVWQSIKVQTLGNTLAQGDRTLLLALSAPTGGATLGTPAETTLTIVDDEAKVRFSAATYKVTEASTATVTVLRSGSSAGTVSVDYALTYLTASAPDLTTAVSGTLTFGPGVTSRTFTVPTRQDTLAEGSETLSLTLSNPAGATLGTPSTTMLTLTDNDVAGTVQWTAAAYSGTERAGGVLATITRTGGAASSVTVSYATSSGTATEALDYAATAGAVTFGAGETTKSVWIPIVADGATEATETFVLTLSDPTGGAALGPQHTALVFVLD